MKFLHKILGIHTPTMNDIAKLYSDVPLGYLIFFLLKDGTISVKTEWSEETDKLAHVYAQLIYQVNSGALEDGILNVLYQHGMNNVKSQEFLAKVMTTLRELKQKYKNLPIIVPSQVLKTKE